MINIYTDGACKGNPGPGGWGALIINDKDKKNKIALSVVNIMGDIEIGTEEIPSRFVGLALDYLKKELASFFKNNRIQADEGLIMGSPRRLVVAFENVDYQQEDVIETHFGPNVKMAYDDEGNPTKSALGFAKGKGINVSQLTIEKTPKGEVVCARIEKTGKKTNGYS